MQFNVDGGPLGERALPNCQLALPGWSHIRAHAHFAGGAAMQALYTFNFTLSATPALNWRVRPLKERPTAQTGLPAAR